MLVDVVVSTVVVAVVVRLGIVDWLGQQMLARNARNALTPSMCVLAVQSRIGHYGRGRQTALSVRNGRWRVRGVAITLRDWLARLREKQRLEGRCVSGSGGR